LSRYPPTPANRNGFGDNRRRDPIRRLPMTSPEGSPATIKTRNSSSSSSASDATFDIGAANRGHLWPAGNLHSVATPSDLLRDSNPWRHMKSSLPSPVGSIRSQNQTSTYTPNSPTTLECMHPRSAHCENKNVGRLSIAKP
jgi:hypothetical protein